jgi:metal-responsive CopG/Arc/MetJ family transcriptional regulator
MERKQKKQEEDDAIQVGVVLPNDLRNMVERLADDENRSRASMIREIIRRYLASRTASKQTSTEVAA